MSLLGIHVPANKNKKIAKAYFDMKLSKADTILQAWRGKYLYIYDKFTINNFLTASQNSHSMSYYFVNGVLDDKGDFLTYDWTVCNPCNIENYD